MSLFRLGFEQWRRKFSPEVRKNCDLGSIFDREKVDEGEVVFDVYSKNFKIFFEELYLRG